MTLTSEEKKLMFQIVNCTKENVINLSFLFLLQTKSYTS